MIRKITKFILVLLSGILLCCSPQNCYAQSQSSAKTIELKPTIAKEYLKKVAPNQKAEEWSRFFGLQKYNCYKGKVGEIERDFCIIKKDENKQDAELVTRGTGILGGKRKGCEVIAVAWNNNKDCLFCGMLKSVYKATDYLTEKSFSTFSTSFASLIAMIFIIWIAIKTLSQVSSLTTQDVSKYLNSIIVQGFKFLIAFLILYNYKWLFDAIIIPIFQAGLDFATAFVDTGTSHTIDTTFVANNKLFTKETYVHMEKFAREINMQLSLLQTVGKSLRCLGGKFLTGFESSILKGSINLGLGLNCVIYGLMFGLIGFLLSLGFIFYLFDAIVELGIFGAILPFAIACWPFKLFSKTAGTAIKLFMNSTFTFMMAGVAVRVCVGLISNAVGSASANNERGLAELVAAVDTIDIETLKEMVGVINVSFLVFIFAGFSGFLFISKIPSITGLFAGGGMSPNASKIATIGASAVQRTAKKIAAPSTKAIDNRINKGVSKMIGKAANSKVGKAVGNITKVSGAALAIGALGGVPALAGAVGIAAVGKIVSARRKSKKRP